MFDFPPGSYFSAVRNGSEIFAPPLAFDGTATLRQQDDAGSSLVARRADKGPITNRLCRIEKPQALFSAAKTPPSGIFWALNGHLRISRLPLAL
jgi:hypothetical protein